MSGGTLGGNNSFGCASKMYYIFIRINDLACFVTYRFSPNIDNNTGKYKIIKLGINRFIAAHRLKTTVIMYYMYNKFNYVYLIHKCNKILVFNLF